jgi:hypothetical protein
LKYSLLALSHLVYCLIYVPYFVRNAGLSRVHFCSSQVIRSNQFTLCRQLLQTSCNKRPPTLCFPFSYHRALQIAVEMATETCGLFSTFKCTGYYGRASHHGIMHVCKGRVWNIKYPVPVIYMHWRDYLQPIRPGCRSHPCISYCVCFWRDIKLLC